MSLVDELRTIEQQVAQRLQELEPVVAEYNQLRAIAERMGLPVDGAQPSRSPSANTAATTPSSARAVRGRRAAVKKPSPNAKQAGAAKAPTATKTPARTATPSAKPATAAKPPTRKAPSNGKAAGRRADDIIRIVSENPGITIAQIAKQLGVDPTGLYRVVRRVQSAGHVTKQGRALTPATAR